MTALVACCPESPSAASCSQRAPSLAGRKVRGCIDARKSVWASPRSLTSFVRLLAGVLGEKCGAEAQLDAGGPSPSGVT